MKKETSRILSVLVISVLVMSLMTGIVVAQDASAPATTSVGRGMNNFVTGIREGGSPLFKALFGSTNDNNELFIKILAFLLVTLVVYGIMNTAGFIGSKWVNLGIGLVISIIGVRFLPKGFLEMAAVPSSAFVAIIVMGLPFLLIGFMLTKVQNPLIRRGIWVGYSVLILILWVINLGNNEIPSAAKWVYPIIFVGCIIAFTFDGTFQRLLGRANAERAVVSATNVSRDKLITQIETEQNRLSSATTQAERNRIIKTIQNLQKSLDAL